VKGWAVFTDGKQEWADYFNDADCSCCRGETNAPAIYLKKRDAPLWNIKNYPGKYKLIECTITYDLPITSKKK